jgi:hypothetical protein|tara:strand:+ start:1240 stop:1416 length:177 start_codon:yes stop_codon:yes gene_type:complete
MGNWKNRDGKLQQRRNLKQQKRFYDSNVVGEKKRKDNKAVIREQRQEKTEEYDRFLDE